jgi:hypothetical protein
MACEFGKISVEALELLIDACPENRTNVNDEKQTPIHAACRSMRAVERCLGALEEARPGSSQDKRRPWRLGPFPP